MGLGLKLAFELKTLIQGSIGVESEIGNGAVFRVCLPLVMNTDKEIRHLSSKRTDITDSNTPRIDTRYPYSTLPIETTA